MKHDRVIGRDGFDIIDAAAIWPRADAMVQGPVSEVEAAIDTRPATAVPDVPAGVGGLIVGAYASIIGIFALTMARGAEATFMITISGLYVAIFLGVPAIFLRVEKDPARRPSMESFMAKGLATHTGHMSGAAALAQIFAVPALVALGLLAIGLAAAWYLP